MEKDISKGGIEKWLGQGGEGEERTRGARERRKTITEGSSQKKFDSDMESVSVYEGEWFVKLNRQNNELQKMPGSVKDEVAILKRERVKEIEKLEKKMKTEREEMLKEMRRKEIKWEEEKKLLWKKITKLEKVETIGEEMEMDVSRKEGENPQSWCEVVRKGLELKYMK